MYKIDNLLKNISEVNMSKIKVLLGRRIKEIRLSQKLTQEKLSEMTGIGTSSISKIESGIYHPSDDNLEKIAEALKVEPYQLYKCEHCKSTEELKKELSLLLANAREEEVMFMYKVMK